MLRTRTLGTVAVMAAAMAFGAGCGLTGGTSKFAVNVATPAGTEKPALNVASVDLEPNQTKLVNVGTYAWGEYDKSDLDVLTQSMKTSAAPFESATGYKVHVVMRRFLVAHSNNAALAFACVGWAVVTPQNTLAFHEQFYASYHVRLWGTVGGVKDVVHEAITKRVLERAVAVATNRTDALPKPVHTFDDYESAAAGLPQQLMSSYTNMLVFGNGYMFIHQTASGNPQLGWVKKPEHLDWNARLGLAQTTGPISQR
jgi:hypothetical protein